MGPGVLPHRTNQAQPCLASDEVESIQEVKASSGTGVLSGMQGSQKRGKVT